MDRLRQYSHGGNTVEMNIRLIEFLREEGPLTDVEIGDKLWRDGYTHLNVDTLYQTLWSMAQKGLIEEVEKRKYAYRGVGEIPLSETKASYVEYMYGMDAPAEIREKVIEVLRLHGWLNSREVLFLLRQKDYLAIKPLLVECILKYLVGIGRVSTLADKFMVVKV